MNEQRKTEMEMNQRERGKKMRRAGSGWVKEISIVGVTRLGEGYIFIYMIKMSRMKEYKVKETNEILKQVFFLIF